MTSERKYYTWITDCIAIGELNADHKPFDVVINLAYINPSFNNGLEHHQYRVSQDSEREIVELALWDSEIESDHIITFLRLAFNHINKHKKENKRVLFHCQSGKSRSVSFALAYLCIKDGLSIEKGLELIKQKRPVANPRKVFVDKVAEFVNEYRV